jgi:ribonucleoside-diphosphate reductase alpha chain
MPREVLPPRRRQWTQKARLGGHTVYLSVGHFADGRPAEVWIETQKAGTFARGVLMALARMTSLALQCGASVAEVVASLKGLSFPPDGPVSGSAAVAEASSLADWIARELEAAYLTPPPPEKVAGHVPEPWRTGA